jgi:hypothetical protein
MAPRPSFQARSAASTTHGIQAKPARVFGHMSPYQAH